MPQPYEVVWHTVGREVASATRESSFKSTHKQFLLSTVLNNLTYNFRLLDLKLDPLVCEATALPSMPQ